MVTCEVKAVCTCSKLTLWARTRGWRRALNAMRRRLRAADMRERERQSLGTRKAKRHKVLCFLPLVADGNVVVHFLSPLARSQVLSLSSEGFQEVVEIAIERLTHSLDEP